jgi:hypothetical protein
VVYTLTNDYVDTYLYQIIAEITKETKYAGIPNGENLSIEITRLFSIQKETFM